MGKKKKNKESPEDKLYNLQAQQLAAQTANWAAQLEFQKERLRLLELPQFQSGLQLEVDKFAWQRAQDEWENAYQESLLTGMYKGQPTTQWLMDQARLTGTFDGQQTLEGKLTDAQIQDMHDKMNLANAQFLAATTGYINGQKTFDRDKFEAAQALEGWKFISTLSGPQNAFKQARAIASAPGGMTQLMDAFAGQYMLPSGTNVGSGGAGGGNPAGQLNDMRMGWGGVTGEQAQPVQYGSTIPGQTLQYNPTPYGPQAPFVPAPTYITPTPPPAAPGAPAAPAPPAAPAYNGPPWASFNPIPRPSDPDYAEKSAQWNAAHPGYIMDSSNIGFHANPGVPMPIPEGPHITPADIAYARGTWGAAGGSVLPPVSPGILPQAQAAQAASPGTVGTTSADYRGITDPGYQAPSPDARGTYGITDPGYQAPSPDSRGTYGITDPGWTSGAAAKAGYSYQPPGVQAPTSSWNYSQNINGSTGVYPPGVTSPSQTADVSTTTPQNPLLATGLMNQSQYQYGGGVQAPQSGTSTGTGGMLAPNQINAENYNNAFNYQKELLWANYEDQGWDKGLAQEAYIRSLPKYGGPSSGSFAF